ncbi:thymidylate synthase [Zavarzinella formosa]|uniref:thymidylate synthase n=1 Tax=Zavarzinella formosa TaxID=360055 RepID=UPI0003096C16|nr:thymidylate synthase [Zavarzinella formosa]
MKAYLDLLREIRTTGARKAQRAALRSDGSRPDVLSVFGRQIRFDLLEGFPLVTTKRMPWNAVVHELLWFLSGSTNVRYLQENKVTIWDEWADESGDLGPIYGKHWRRWEGPQGTVDQVANVIAGIRKVIADPHASEARRLLITAWNPADMPSSKVPTGCHTLVQFNVTGNRLSCQLYQRSADMFLGVPFNIASYALFTHIMAKHTGLEPGDFVHTFGDAHIYENHFEAVDEQLKREPFPLPKLEIIGDVSNIDAVRADQLKIIGYQCHARLPGEVAV